MSCCCPSGPQQVTESGQGELRVHAGRRRPSVSAAPPGLLSLPGRCVTPGSAQAGGGSKAAGSASGGVSAPPPQYSALEISASTLSGPGVGAIIVRRPFSCVLELAGMFAGKARCCSGREGGRGQVLSHCAAEEGWQPEQYSSPGAFGPCSWQHQGRGPRLLALVLGGGECPRRSTSGVCALAFWTSGLLLAVWKRVWGGGPGLAALGWPAPG